MSGPSPIEKESLEAHVELCAIRYVNLEQKLIHVENRMDKFERHLVDIKRTLGDSDKKNSDKVYELVKSIMIALLAGLLGFFGSGFSGFV